MSKFAADYLPLYLRTSSKGAMYGQQGTMLVKITFPRAGRVLLWRLYLGGSLIK